jgi:hypothetical protein
MTDFNIIKNNISKKLSEIETEIRFIEEYSQIIEVRQMIEIFCSNCRFISLTIERD